MPRPSAAFDPDVPRHPEAASAATPLIAPIAPPHSGVGAVGTAQSRRRFFRLEKFVYRTAGLPVALRLALTRDRGDPLDEAFRREFWHPRHLNQWFELIAAILLAPLTVPGAIIITTARHGPAIRRREGRGIAAQASDQFKLYFTAGILPPWYYLFELHRDASTDTARSYLNRFQTDGGIYLLTRGDNPTPLNDKKDFSDRCEAHGIRHVRYLLHLDSMPLPGASLPDTDLFVKPTKGRGGKGAERWSCIEPGIFAAPSGERLGRDALLHRLSKAASHRRLLVQPRLRPHADLEPLSTGALPTVRVVTCIDENGEPEAVEALFRMSQGKNSTVDNFHAGGLATEVPIASGRLGQASGQDSRAGWLSHHPDTGARIEGAVLPLWEDAKALAVGAHKAFSDRKIVGWDIAILENGPIIVEGNSSPDLDMHQRVRRSGLRTSRLAELLRFHVARRLPQVDT
jgi:hypothetical protein